MSHNKACHCPECHPECWDGNTFLYFPDSKNAYEEMNELMPELVESCFPKGQCKERGKALVLVGMIMFHLKGKLNDRIES